MEDDVVDPPKPGDPPWRSRRAHRSLHPHAAAILRTARQARGWSIREAAKRSTISRRMIGMMEAAERVPSTATAELLIKAYQLDGENAAVIRSAGLPNVGRSSPYRTGHAATTPGAASLEDRPAATGHGAMP
jgi:transcriptional regulator with XRE-family HTH domain